MAQVTVTDEQWDAFHAAVNMTSNELREWLALDANEAAEAPTDALDVGTPSDADDRELGRHVLAVLGKRRTDLTSADVEAMGHVQARVERLREDVGDEPVSADERLRHRLMSLGHDVLRG